ncbi:MAG: pantetheine-phosphate adenylyltransferase [Anaerolineae bacterium]|nr:pantetheine-phosphate adenylyltransferase [Anaerolineae bacterium]
MIKAVFPGTFDPIHYGHIDIARRASQLFDELVVAVYDKPLKNLVFSAEERLEMVRESFLDDANIHVMPFSGLVVEFCQQIEAKVIVRGLRVFSDFEHEFRMAHANRRLAPVIDTMMLITVEQQTFLSSTTVREIASLGGNISTMVPPHVQKALTEHFNSTNDGEDGRHVTSLRD